jgi:threonine dehydrogenase-like Zn-dependent dehydrogenase
MNNPQIIFPQAREVILQDSPMPVPGEGEVLVKSRCTLISTGTELTMLSGDYPKGSLWDTRWGKFPVQPGYSNIGEVVGLGPGVDDTWLGARVASTGKHARCNALPAATLTRLPEGLVDEEAAFFTISGICMNGVRRAKVGWGDAVVVFGLGLLGQFTVRYSRLSGAWPVIGVDVAPRRLGLLPDDPGVHALNPQETEALEAIKALTRGRLADCAFELTGVASLIPEEIQAVRRQGRFAILSSPRGNTDFNFCDLCHYPSISIIGIHTLSHPPVETNDYQWTFGRHTELFFDLLGARQIETAPLITHRGTWEEGPALFEMLLEDRSEAMGVVLDWTAGG